MTIMDILTNGRLLKQAEQLAADLPAKVEELVARLTRLEVAIEQSNVMISQVWHCVVAPETPPPNVIGPIPSFDPQKQMQIVGTVPGTGAGSQPVQVAQVQIAQTIPLSLPQTEDRNTPHPSAR